MRATTKPSGKLDGAIMIWDKLSAKSKIIIETKAVAQARFLLSNPTSSRAMCGAIKPIKARPPTNKTPIDAKSSANI